MPIYLAFPLSHLINEARAQLKSQSGGQSHRHACAQLRVFTFFLSEHLQKPRKKVFLQWRGGVNSRNQGKALGRRYAIKRA